MKQPQPLTLVVEDKIPFLRGVPEGIPGVGTVRYLPAAQITPEAMRDADALLTRTRTRCDASLLEGSRCRFIGTATIGTDHIDLPWCASAGITVANAPGCNAPAVAQWVLRAVERVCGSPAGLTIAVVGVGAVGSIVSAWAASVGMRVLQVDPPRAAREGADGFVTLMEAAREADVVTLHTPLTFTGDHPTHHLLDSAFFAACRRKPLIMNAARGPVLSTQALLEALRRGDVSAAAIDCWEGEPHISPELLDRAAVATPHVAGYSREGKIRATAIALRAFCRHFGLPMPQLPVEVPPMPGPAVEMAQVVATYPIDRDTLALKANPGAFEALRNGYPLRPEPPSLPCATLSHPL